MIYDGVNLDYKYRANNLHWGLNREVKPPLFNIELKDVPGRNGEHVSNAGNLTDAEYTYTAWLEFVSEYDRTETLRRFRRDISRGTKCELIDPRDNGLTANAVLTEYKHKKYGQSPLVELLELTFQIDPYLKKTVEYTQDITKEIKNFGNIEVGFVMELSISSQTNMLNIHKTTSSEVMTINFPFKQGNKVVIDTVNNVITINGSLANKYLADTSDFILLDTGINTFQVNNATGIIKYKELYSVE